MRVLTQRRTTRTTTPDPPLLRVAQHRWRRALPGWLVELWIRGQALLLYLFLYAPIAVVVIYSFNDSRRVALWGGFTTRWYAAAWSSPDVTRALQISLTVASLNAILAVTLGTLAALGM